MLTGDKHETAVNISHSCGHVQVRQYFLYNRIGSTFYKYISYLEGRIYSVGFPCDQTGNLFVCFVFSLAWKFWKLWERILCTMCNSHCLLTEKGNTY